ncbi:Mov34/MPN/PAD-1 family protein [Caballeronia sp. SEWSISQ10-4 2]|uniref:Mov34/MPN/PAD-1 family protein n=1 Tax=Caballeronia sp. SEWSISQ10-4 2 TaxID=2937438 RepID=UPI003462E3AD
MGHLYVGGQIGLPGVHGGMNKLWIGEGAFNYLVDEAERTYPLETGGVLVGYFANNGEPVVQYVVGPGPEAIHERNRFGPDHEWQCRALDEIFEMTSARSVYLGDWHTHPDGTPVMSWLDRRTLRGIARYSDAALARPLMLIGGGSNRKWAWKVHQYTGELLGGFLIQHTTGTVRVF